MGDTVQDYRAQAKALEMKASTEVGEQQAKDLEAAAEFRMKASNADKTGLDLDDAATDYEGAALAREGLGKPANIKKAAEHWQQAADIRETTGAFSTAQQDLEASAIDDNKSRDSVSVAHHS